MKFRDANFFLCLVICSLIQVGLYLYCLPVWARPDDPIMGMVTQGFGFVHKPYEFIPPTNSYLATLLTYLSKVSTSIHWYGVLVIALTWLSFFCAVFLFADLSRSFRDKFIGILILTIIYVEPLSFVTFTKASILLAFTSLLLLRKAVLGTNISWKVLLFSAIGFTLASQLRFQGALLSLLFFLCLMFVMQFTKLRAAKFKYLFSISLSFLFVALLFQRAHTSRLSSQTEWKNFDSTWGVIVYFLDFQRDIQDPYLKKRFRALDVYESEIALLKHWMFPPAVFSDAKVLALKDYIPKPKATLLQSSLFVLKEVLLDRRTLFLFFVSMVFFLSCRSGLMGLSATVFLFGILIYLAHFKKIPERVYIPFVSLLPLSIGILKSLDLSFVARKQFHILFIIALVWMNLSQLRYVKKNCERIREINHRFLQDLNELKPDPGIRYLWWNGSWFEHLSVFRFPDKELRDLNLIGFGSMSRSGYSSLRLRDLGIDDPILSSINSQKLLWVSDSITNNLLKKYFKDRHQMDIEFDLLFQGKLIQVWRAKNIKMVNLSQF